MRSTESWASTTDGKPSFERGRRTCSSKPAAPALSARRQATNIELRLGAPAGRSRRLPQLPPKMVLYRPANEHRQEGLHPGISVFGKFALDEGSDDGRGGRRPT